MGNKRNRYRKKEGSFPIDLGVGLLYTIFLISLGLLFAINFRFLYYADIHWFNLEQFSGLSSAVIKENYNALIDYCSPFYQGTLKFPSLPASDSGLSHFAEVKVLFNVFYIALAITFVVLVIVSIYKIKKGQSRFLLVSSITVIILPLLTLAACAVNFNQTFVIFHKIFFRNDDWLFDPVTDPIINILPEKFFLQCAIVIIVTVLLGSLILYLTYRRKNRKKNQPPLVQRKKNYYY